MKIYRYKIIVGDDIRILSIGVNKTKYNKWIGSVPKGDIKKVDKLYHKLSVSMNDPNTHLDINILYVDYSFAYSIVNMVDTFDIKEETYKLEGRIEHISYSEYDIEIPNIMDNMTVTKGFVLSYRAYLINYIISNFKDVTGKEIKIEDYEVKE